MLVKALACTATFVQPLKHFSTGRWIKSKKNIAVIQHHHQKHLEMNFSTNCKNFMEIGTKETKPLTFLENKTHGDRMKFSGWNVNT
jgi:hypothetical protein